MPTPGFVLKLREKIGHDPISLVGVCAIVLNRRGEVLLQQRADFGYWHTLGGVVEPGEAPAGCVVREAMEETGIAVRVLRLTGVYTLPEITYPNGDRVFYTSITFLCETVEENPVPVISDDESLDLRFFPQDKLPALKPDSLRRIQDALAGRPDAAFDR